ncbi:MAG: protein kinase [Ferrovum sp.]|nr:protein kinase [Ferrovum sp.]
MSDRKDIRWRLASNAVLVSLDDINLPRLWGQIVEGWMSSEPCYVLYRPGSRSGPMAVNAQVRNLLRRFHHPMTFIEAVIRTARAENDNPHHTLKQLQPVVFGLIQRGILVQADAFRCDTAPATMHTLCTGSRFRDYVVKATIRSLRDSEVYLIESVRDGMPCVLKIEGRHCEGTTGKQRIQQALLREFNVLNELREAPTCELIEQGRWRGRVFGILSHVGFQHVQREAWRIRDEAGSDRASRLSILQLFCACLGVLEKVHAHGYLHGDIHPGNFLVDEVGEVRIVDFGGAQRIDRHGKGLLGHQGGVVHYLPPEVAADRIKGNCQTGWTIASEIYAAAALGYELLTGQRHLPSRMYKEDALAQIVSTPARTFARIGVAPWPDIERVLRKALATKPSQRYSSVRSFRIALLRARSFTAKGGSSIA